MKRSNSTSRLTICWQMLSVSILVTIVTLTISEITKIEFPKISDRDIIFWLVDINN